MNIYDGINSIRQQMPAIVSIVDDLLFKHKEAIFEGQFQNLSEDFRQQLLLGIQYSSPVVSGQISFQDGFKLGRDLVDENLELGRNLYVDEKFGKWRVRFPQNNRFMNAADLEDESELIFYDDKEEFCFTHYDHVVDSCKTLAKSYKDSLLDPPIMEIIPFDKKGLPIDWLIYEYQATP